MLGGPHGIGEQRAGALVGDDPQHGPVPGSALPQQREQLRGGGRRVEPAPMRPPQPHLVIKLALVADRS